MCMTCVTDLNRSYSFRIKCENSEKTLKSLVENIYGAEEEIQEEYFQSDGTLVQSTSLNTRDHKYENDFEVSKMSNNKNLNTILIDNDILFLINEEPKQTDSQEIDENEEIEIIQQEAEEADNFKDPDYEQPAEINCEDSQDLLKCNECGIGFVRKKNFEKHVLKCQKSPAEVILTIGGNRKRNIVEKEVVKPSPSKMKVKEKETSTAEENVEVYFRIGLIYSNSINLFKFLGKMHLLRENM